MVLGGHTGTLTNILLLEFTREVALDKGGLADPAVADQYELELWDASRLRRCLLCAQTDDKSAMRNHDPPAKVDHRTASRAVGRTMLSGERMFYEWALMIRHSLASLETRLSDKNSIARTLSI